MKKFYQIYFLTDGNLRSYDDSNYYEEESLEEAMETLIEEFPNAEFVVLTKYKRIDVNFYCQSDIEGESPCEVLCEHCAEYYAPLENKN